MLDNTKNVIHKIKILCVDDEPMIHPIFKGILEAEGYEVFSACSGNEALSILEKVNCDIAFIDYKMPVMNGIELIKKIKEKKYCVKPVIVSGYGEISLVVQAMKEGAWDYILKPAKKEILVSAINKIMQSISLLRKKDVSMDLHAEKFNYENLVGNSESMMNIYAIIEKLKDIDENVLIQGESGTGKEQIAKAIHFSGKRKNEPFIPCDCTAINPNVIENELFGHIKGAYTGASQDKIGLLKSAGKGTIFLDEITEISPDIQVKLLRAIQEKEIRPVGSNRTDKIDARIIAATNRNLDDLIKKGEFREDLFYRLNVVCIHAPPLKENKDDIPTLINYFIEKFVSNEKEINGITSNALDVLMSYNWPGNVRELENCIKSAVIFGIEELIDVKDLPEEILSRGKIKSGELKTTIIEIEKEKIIESILKFKGNKRKAAEFLGICKSTLYNKLKKYNIDYKDL